MRTIPQGFAIGTAIIAGTAFAVSAQTGTGRDHRITTAEEITWQAGPASLPDGAEAAVLYGDPSADGLFALRLKLPSGYRIAPHTHPEPEVVTVISGTFHLGMGERFNRDQARALPEGSFFAMPPGSPHFAFTSGETVIQLNSTGPWTLSYIDPADDPRRQGAQAGRPAGGADGGTGSDAAPAPGGSGGRR